VTVWADRFEIFMEYPFLVAGTPGAFVTHVTNIADFSPRVHGPVTFVLQQGAQRIEQPESAPKRPGIYIPELVFPTAGTWSATLQIPRDGKNYELKLPSVRVYADQAQADQAPDQLEPEGFSFLKEQQWIIPFLVEPVKAQTVKGTPCWIVPDTALVYEGDASFVYVQVRGETYAQRPVHVKNRSQGMATIDQGLSDQDYVVTRGTGSVVWAASQTALDVHAQDHAITVPATRAQIQQLGIKVAAARAGGIDDWLSVPGEIEINEDRMAHIAPRVGGVVSEVHAHLGDVVQAGQILAVIESRDLADAKATYLSAQQILELAQTSFQREKTLYTQKVSSEQEYLSAKQALAEAQIQWRSARHKMLTFGLSPADLEALPSQAEEMLTMYNLTAPFSGTLIQKHLALGEVVDNHSEVLVIADLSSVWVDLLVNQKDIISVSKGQKALVSLGTDHPVQAGIISYVDPMINEASRTAIARLILTNTDGQYRPGLFVKGRIRVKQMDHAVLVPEESVQIVDDQPHVFVESPEGFVMQAVTLGTSDRGQVEILSGLHAGDPIVTKNAFHLKAEHEKQAGGGHSGHGHSH
jgi:membrane fusion protein, heavy metal efflux system